jgi:hypothetical protein
VYVRGRGKSSEPDGTSPAAAGKLFVVTTKVSSVAMRAVRSKTKESRSIELGHQLTLPSLKKE